MSASVELRGVSMDFDKYRAVDNVSVKINPGEFFSFLGPSGCGKTTILRMVSGFIEPTQGQVLIGDKDMRGIGPNKRPTAMIFQNLALFPLMKIWENISFGLEVRGVDKATRRAKAEELLRLVELEGVADRLPSQLSGGQRQRVAIARALAVEPQLMLLDEPLSALDLKLRQHMRAELRAIQKRTNVTFIYITHDQGEALAMSDRVAVMSRGQIQQVDIPQKIYNTPSNGFVASFVGENNKFSGTLSGISGREGKFKTDVGEFAVTLGEGVTKDSKCRLYVRPEHVGFVAKPKASTNFVPVTVEDVSFEGNFAVALMRDRTGKRRSAELRNDPANPPPPPGTATNITFDADKALVLLDSEAVAYEEKE
ncbi:MAG: ABC transporter ATP-binding protein [Alphaproteobacteria bacterium]|nr:ABC transporter ATP-binding protein [Alphaproteobacteria bacterium]